jgi:hypothetical protein
VLLTKFQCCPSGTLLGFCCQCPNAHIHPIFQASKDNETNKGFTAQGATIVPFDVDAPDALDATDRLSGYDVFISAVRVGRVSELRIAHLLKEQGAKLFIPSAWEHSADVAVRDQPKSVWTSILESCTEAEKIGLPVATFSCGPWPEFHPCV